MDLDGPIGVAGIAHREVVRIGPAAATTTNSWQAVTPIVPSRADRFEVAPARSCAGVLIKAQRSLGSVLIRGWRPRA